MRAILMSALAVTVGCSDSMNADDPFVDTGGTLEISRCDYSVTTRLGAEAPHPSGSVFGTDPTPRVVHLGLIGDPRTSIVAQWRTVDDTTTASEIRYGLAPDQLTQKLAGIQFGYRPIGTTIYRIHQAHLCGLQPGTTYSYKVGSVDKAGVEHFSPVYSFHTAPDVVAHPDAEVVMGFVGDSRGGYDVWGQLVAQIQQRTPDLMLFSGDATTIGLTQPEWEDFLGEAEPLFATVPVVLTNGNHEANAINFYSQFAMPGDQENFSFDYGFAHIFVANDTPDDIGTLTGSTPAAIDADLTAHDAARWKLLMHHQPMWSSGTRHGSNLTLRAAWGPIVDAHQVDLVLNGHEHQYEVSQPLAGGNVQPTSATGTVYVVAGVSDTLKYEAC